MKKRLLLLSVLLSLAVGLGACFQITMVPYYRDAANYSDYSGVLSYIHDDEAAGVLYLSFDDITPKTADDAFKVVGENYALVCAFDLNETLAVGKTIQFVTAPKYYGDGYVMPIVGLSVDGTVLLDQEAGIRNWIEWLEQ